MRSFKAFTIETIAINGVVVDRYALTSSALDFLIKKQDVADVYVPVFFKLKRA